ncbi:unnamed protein product [Adineta ricciae]|uniref:F-box domain-containing protein n=2 Tax=Adineta ricciae TaxID=249248 RepID=A0A815P8K6_ADIRI|nr:unnamed protein product [Adineta ricciae]
MNMNEKKRSRDPTANDYDDESNPTKKFSVISSFEQLSNEIIYEILTHLDAYEIYQSFFDINIRFRNLCNHSDLTVQIDTQFESKSKFQSYYNDFITSNKHHVQSLRLFDPLIVDFFALSPSTISQCIDLRQLILCEIQNEFLESVLLDIVSLPKLSSLSIHVGCGANKPNIYESLFRLPVLKSCKINFREKNPIELLPMSSNLVSPIEDLVIYDHYNLPDIDIILSYVPKLHRLSVAYQCNTNIHPFQSVFAVLFNNETHISLIGTEFSYLNLDKFIKNHVSHIKILQISTSYRNAYPSIERFIQPYFSHLKTWDFNTALPLDCVHTMKLYQNMFESYPQIPLYIRQLFFTQTPMSDEYLHKMFSSIRPYSSNSIYLIHRSCMNFQCHNETDLYSIEHLIIPERLGSCQCISHFPNVKKLTLYEPCFKTNLSSMISLTQLTSLSFYTSMKTIDVIIEILCLTPNVQTVTLTLTTMRAKSLPALRESLTSQHEANFNQIKSLTFKLNYTMVLIQFFMKLCPQLRHLRFGTYLSSLEPTLRYLLTETTEKHFSIHVSSVSAKRSEILRALIESQELSRDYLIKIINDKFYFRWWD